MVLYKSVILILNRKSQKKDTEIKSGWHIC